MTDTFGRTIAYLRLSITDLCNYRCQYCMPERGICKKDRADILSLEECLEIAQAAVDCGVRKIRITGGEPLIRPGIVELCRSLREMKGLEELCLTTNGSRLQTLAKPLRAAGVDRLNVSLDSLQADKFRTITRGGDLNEVLKGLQSAKEAGFRNTKLNVVLIGGLNTDEISDFVALTAREPIQIRFIELMPMGACRDWEKACFLSGQVVLQTCPDLEFIGSDGVAELFRLPNALGDVGLIHPISHHFCEQCNRIRVTADGKLKPCLHSAAEIMLRGLHGDALREQLRAGMAAKPERHHLEDKSATGRTMNQIGG